MIRTALVFAALLLCSLQVTAAPFINITTPSNNANFTAPADVTVTSSVFLSEDRERVTLHRIFRNGLQIASGGTKTMSTVVSGLPPGNYQVYSVVTTNTGVTKQSVPVNFTIVPAANVPPNVSMNTPTGAPFVTPAPVGLSANVSDPDGWITKVEYYRDGTLIASSTTSPFNVATTLYSPGTYWFHARAVDNSGAGVNSAAVPVTVAANVPPSVAVVAPARGTNYLTPTTIQIEATASDSDGWVTRVAFSANGTSLGEDTSPPYTATWVTGELAGPMTISATAYDDKGVGTGGTTYVNLNSPNGSITVNPKPCIILSGDSCDTAVSWSSNDPAAQLWRHFDRWVTTQEGITELRHFEQLAATGASGSAVFDVGGAKLSQYFQLKSGATLLAQQGASKTYPAWTTLTSPAANQLYQAPASVVISATATDPDQDPIAKVDFYADGVFIGTDTQPPYTTTWASGPGGHTVGAQAFDIHGASRPVVSTTIDVNAQPTVALTSPAHGIVMLPGEVVALGAAASDADGTIARVEFMADGGLIATDTTSPFEATWVPATAKTYALTAVAYDNRGGIAASGVHSLVINGPPTIRLTAPVVGDVARANQLVTLAADAQDVEGVAKVEFFVGEALVGTVTSAPYSVQWTPSAAGNYRVTAKATDIHGFAALSMPRMLGALPANAILRRYVYDSQKLLCKSIEPETGATVTAYDGAGNIAWTAAGLSLPNPSSGMCDSDRATAFVSASRVSRTYDSRNRIRTLTFGDQNGSQVWEYTPDGLPQAVVTSNDAGATAVTNAYQYNERRLLMSESLAQIGHATLTVEYQYDANANLRTHVYPGGLAVQYSPNALGQPRQVGAFAQAVQYHPNGAVKQFNYGNGITHAMERNDRGLPDHSMDAAGAVKVVDDSYDYDQNGNVLAISDGVPGSRGNRDMVYDGLDRLREVTSAMFGTDPRVTYSYDHQDNVIGKHAGGLTLAYFYDARNQLTNITQSGETVGGIGYDAQGNVTNYSGRVYTFDVGNRLRAVSGGITYGYDAHGRRVAESAVSGSRRFLYSADAILRYSDDGDALSAHRYLYLGSSLVARVDASGNVEYSHTDALGSPIAYTDAQGLVLRRNEYAPYGEILSGTALQGPGFTGHFSDAATGLTYMQQRYYEPRIGRFLSVDPVTADSSTGTNFNRYWYANNNPYRFIDPDGRFGCTGTHIKGNCADGGAGSAVGGMAKSAHEYQGKDSSVPDVPSEFGELNRSHSAPKDPSLFKNGNIFDIEALAHDVIPPFLDTPEGVSFKVIGAGAFAVRIGMAGEDAVRAAYQIGGRGVFTVGWRVRIADGMTKTTLSEVKNVASLSYTRQLRDYAEYARSTGRTFDLYVRPATKLSQPLLNAIKAGEINLKLIP